MKQFLFIAITSLALLSSCRKPTPSISISVSMPEGGLSVSGGTVRVNVTSDGEWRTSTDDGIAVNPSSGTGNSSVTITVPANTTSGVRDVKVRFYSSRNTSVGQTVTILQKSPRVSVTLNDSTAVSASGGTVKVTVESEGEWKTSADDGIAVNPSSGTGNASVTITVPANTSDSARDVQVIFRSALNSSVSDSVTIRQESTGLSVNPPSTEVAASGGQVEFTVTANGGWTASAEYGATVTPPSGSGNGAVKVQVPANTTGQERKVKVTFSSTDKPSLFKEVIIHQKSISISVTPSRRSVAASGGTVSFDVTAYGTWKASAACGAAVNPSEWSISGVKQADVTVPANTTGRGREVTVKFWLKDNTSIFRTVTISQNFIAIIVTPNTAEVPASGGTVDVTVASIGEWETTVGKWKESNGEEISTTATDKVALSPSTGTGYESVEVTVPANATGQERYVEVTFRSKLKSSISETVTIHQKAPSISVTGPTEEVPAEGGTAIVYVTSDGGWTVSADNGAKVSPNNWQDSGNNVPVSIEIPENTTANAKKVTVTFKSALNTSVTKKVTINQKAPGISVDPTEIRDVPAGETTYTVNVTYKYTWKSIVADWTDLNGNLFSTTYDKVTRFPSATITGNKAVKVTVPKNSSGKARKATVVFYSTTDEKISQTVTVYQKASD